MTLRSKAQVRLEARTTGTALRRPALKFCESSSDPRRGQNTRRRQLSFEIAGPGGGIEEKMPPKKKQRGEGKGEVLSGEDGESEQKNDHGESTSDNAAASSSQLSQHSIGVGGPDAPRIELNGIELVEYAPGKLLEGYTVGTLIRCDIEAKYLTVDAEGLKQRKIWGSDPYTDNSDPIAMATHASLYIPSADVPKFSTLVMVVRIVKHQGTFHPSTKGGLKSRCLTGPEHNGLAIHVEGSAFCKTPEDKGRLTHALLRPIRQVWSPGIGAEALH